MKLGSCCQVLGALSDFPWELRLPWGRAQVEVGCGPGDLLSTWSPAEVRWERLEIIEECTKECTKECTNYKGWVSWLGRIWFVGVSESNPKLVQICVNTPHLCWERRAWLKSLLHPCLVLGVRIVAVLLCQEILRSDSGGSSREAGQTDTEHWVNCGRLMVFSTSSLC